LIEQIFKDWFLDHRQEVTEHTSSHNKQFNNTLNTFCKTSGPVHSDSEFYHVKKTNDVQPSQAQSNEQEAPDESADSAAPTSEVNSD